MIGVTARLCWTDKCSTLFTARKVDTDFQVKKLWGAGAGGAGFGGSGSAGMAS